VIASPGIEIHAPILKAARARGIPVMGELELAYQFCRSARIIAVTGTNGKTTTTRLVGSLLKTYGHDPCVAGNIGRPFIEAVDEIHPQTIVVLEVSSFQLETVHTFRPHVSVFLNFAANHLDRHRSLRDYFDAKCQILAHQTEHDFAVVSRHLALLPTARPRVLYYEKTLPELKYLALSAHQRANLAAALTACRVLDPAVGPGRLDLSQALAIPHRVEFVGEVNRVRFYDDSKATNVAATLAALEMFDAPLVPILGGHHKGGDYSPLARAIARKRVERVVLIGEASTKILRTLHRVGFERVSLVRDLKEAVALAARHPGSVCLLSPACSSFDMFKNYEERGEAFRRAVQEIAPSGAGC
jgi:UDP-N-acetylmuramoylalanine--D-glutamate ligase